MSDWQQVNVRVKEHNFKDWEKHAESEYSTMAEMVRTAVRREMNGSHEGESGAESGASGEMVQEVAKAIDSLENTVGDIDRRLTAVRETVESTGPDFSFRAAVRETVPENGEGGLTAGEIAARLDARESDVAEVIEDLEYHEEVIRAGGTKENPLWERWD